MRNERRRKKNIPTCPFCGRDISRPVLTKTDLGEILSGKCECNALFVCDLTGHCVGEAYMEALVLLKGDWDIGILDPDKDYSYSDMDYDYRTHKKIDIKKTGESPGKLVFLQKKGDNKDLTASPAHEEITDMKGKATQKKVLKKLLQAGDLEKIIRMSSDDNGIINLLFAFSYDKEDIMTWRAIESVGLIAKKLSKNDPEFIRNTARRLLWSMTEESGGISWSAPEMIGEIIRADPNEFADFIPILWSNRNEDVFRAGTLWAMGRIAEVSPESIAFISQELRQMIADSDPQIRGYSIWVLGKIDGIETINEMRKFTNDENQINFYRNGSLIKISVGKIAQETINSIS